MGDTHGPQQNMWQYVAILGDFMIKKKLNITEDPNFSIIF